MPEELIRSSEEVSYNNYQQVYKLSGKFGVSASALLFRTYNLKIISAETYRQMKKEADIGYKIFLEKEAIAKLKLKEKKGGGPNPYRLLLNKNSRLFSQVVLDAFNSGSIAPTMASSLLNTQVNNFPKLEAFMYK